MATHHLLPHTFREEACGQDSLFSVFLSSLSVFLSLSLSFSVFLSLSLRLSVSSLFSLSLSLSLSLAGSGWLLNFLLRRCSLSLSPFLSLRLVSVLVPGIMMQRLFQTVGTQASQRLVAASAIAQRRCLHLHE
ncbi:uncharacterized protein MONBRDRAFT_23576, partial [Monosiga brevicollis MX1]